ncbi:MAG: DUF4384 domain-containing protein [Deltaproteobacteria bacterium]|nr:DUF4384 domain-containing protein [Deltaproteobacteria bacterium]
MRRVFIAWMVSFFLISPLYASQSTITEADGYSCMGYDKSRKQTEEEALANAKRKAVEYATTYIESETRVKDFQLEKDIISAYAHAAVKIIQEVEKGWYKDQSTGDCYRIRIKAEVIPDDSVMKRVSKDKNIIDDPSAPLNVQIWTDRKEFRQGDKIKIYLKGNKPFYARVIYQDTGRNMDQLLPNPYRTDTYFNGGVVYEIPSGEDRFELEVSPPFGEEQILVYAGTSLLGDIKLESAGGLYRIGIKTEDIGNLTRGVTIKAKEEGKGASASEFFEDKVMIRTRK